jgi:hypothetical protein
MNRAIVDQCDTQILRWLRIKRHVRAGIGFLADAYADVIHAESKLIVNLKTIPTGRNAWADGQKMTMSLQSQQ